MDLAPNEQQQQIIDSVERLLTRRETFKRAIELVKADAHDEDLHQELVKLGFLGIALGDGFGPLDAAIMVERISYGGGLVSAGASALVYPMVVGESTDETVALGTGDGRIPFRFAGNATTALILQDGDVIRLPLTSDDAERVPNARVGYPLGRLKVNVGKGESLGSAAADRMRHWWRVAIAIEIAGAAKAALDTTVRYVQEREQFGRPIGSFQAVQHHLANLTVQVEATRLLALRAASSEADPVDAAVAASHAASTSPNVYRESHQLHGAMGFTREYPLHVWTMRLLVLQRELGGSMAHAREVTRRRYMSAQPRAHVAAI
jgi:alkylation response protein AidB-like acyl-CoA dehydrogenase